MAKQSWGPGRGHSSWSELVTLEPGLRALAISERFDRVLALPERQAELAVEEMVVGEHVLEAVDRDALTTARLRALLVLAAQDLERARRLQRMYDRVVARLPPHIAEPRSVMLHRVSGAEFGGDEVERLARLSPALRAQLSTAVGLGDLGSRGATDGRIGVGSMTTQPPVPLGSDSTWGNLVTLDPKARAAAIRARFDEVLAFGDEEMDARIREMIVAEYELPTTALHTFTAARLRVLLSIAGEDAERARRLERAYDRMIDHLPGALAMRRTVAVQTIARNELEPQEVELLRGLFPSLLDQLPRAATSGMAAGGTPHPGQVRDVRKPWWKLW